ncbi:hypothetical protein CCM_05968 [Cordyceps militaris CM01]|uniref:Uncharacterized protein n=1 Tax=Cordyceps militaris (strain CM01) TaxID=983644 RepID=G3JI08_CORMM|nr:uncharacterized protein CCM_05968 [Cordyceps militaris CM01]EGX91811.1 hypothetical protein CCM_05968 [Cordyceps militaris CM01]
MPYFPSCEATLGGVNGVNWTAARSDGKKSWGPAGGPPLQSLVYLLTFEQDPYYLILEMHWIGGFYYWRILRSKGQNSDERKHRQSLHNPQVGYAVAVLLSLFQEFGCRVPPVGGDDKVQDCWSAATASNTHDTLKSTTIVIHDMSDSLHTTAMQRNTDRTLLSPAPLSWSTTQYNHTWAAYSLNGMSGNATVPIESGNDLWREWLALLLRPQLKPTRRYCIVASL